MLDGVCSPWVVSEIQHYELLREAMRGDLLESGDLKVVNPWGSISFWSSWLTLSTCLTISYMSLTRGIFEAFFDSELSECWLSLEERDLFHFRPLSIRAVSADEDRDKGGREAFMERFCSPVLNYLKCMADRLQHLRSIQREGISLLF